ncbi:hypothetical protein MLD38_035880 [Melastoma candidum]|uniref:Uncharacterized protein n=1 Tax=Melastoma candidum TaxID=119954 RepID=A0ACB9LIM7_9MYRT|nr:hypothetical protein MLD38_035880 [Melastoma candidum]
MPTAITSLPLELLSLIYSFLIASDDYDYSAKSFRLVSKRFREVDSLCRPRLRVLRVEFLQTLLSTYPNLRELDLSVCPALQDGTVSLVLAPRPHNLFSRVSYRSSVCSVAASARDELEHSCSRSRSRSRFSGLGFEGKVETTLKVLPRWTRQIEKLILCRTSGLGPVGLEKLLAACEGLQSVDVSYCCFNGDLEAAAIVRGNCGSLREIIMDKSLQLTDIGVAKIAKGCGERLERLSLKWCLQVGDIGVEILSNKCSRMRRLDVSGLKITDESLQSIGSLSKLEELSLVGCPFVSDTGLKFLGDGCPLLKVLDVTRCNNISAAGLGYVIARHENLEQLYASYCLKEFSSFHCHLKGLNKLKAIKVDGSVLSGTILEALGKYCPLLEEIGLSKVKGLTDTGLVQLAYSSIKLKSIDLSCCNFIMDSAICALAVSCCHLAILKLESCCAITKNSLLSLGMHCRSLRELDLTDCMGVDDEGLEYLSKCRGLSCLKLGLCLAISNKGIRSVASNCQEIIEIDLYRCIGVRDEALAALSSGCKKLRTLNLSYCTEVTDIGMKHLSQLKQLSALEIRGLVNITSIGLTAVAAGCSILTELDMKFCENVNDSGFWALALYSRNLQQINFSYCNISDVAICMVMSNLTRIQDAKLVHLNGATLEGLELALQASFVRIKKVKLLSALRFKLSPYILDTLRARGCRMRWD